MSRGLRLDRMPADGRVGKATVHGSVASSAGSAVSPSQKRGGRSAHVAHHMSKTEERYARTHLDLLVRGGVYLDWKFEELKFFLAEGRCFYTPDFAVWLPNRALEVHEVKGGHWEDDARVKWRVAIRLFPLIVFRVVTWDKDTRMFAEVEVHNVVSGVAGDRSVCAS